MPNRKVMPLRESQWRGKRVAFLGDSITDVCHVGTEKNYWQYLSEGLGIEPFVYGLDGDTWAGIYNQAKRLREEHGDDVDAISVFCGTNDYMGGVPLGEWYTVSEEEVNTWGKMAVKRRRHFSQDVETFRGRINRAMAYLKETFVNQQIFLVTPIHRAFATFSDENVQPEETFPNDLGLYVDSYVEAIKEAGNVWAAPVIDLNATSGLYPLFKSHVRFFHDEKTDMLHPNAEGHYRIAKAMLYQMLAMAPDFR